MVSSDTGQRPGVFRLRPGVRLSIVPGEIMEFVFPSQVHHGVSVNHVQYLRGAHRGTYPVLHTFPQFQLVTTMPERGAGVLTRTLRN